MITGSVAGAMYGRERTTLDIDVVIELERADPERVASAFSPEFLLQADMVRAAAATGTMFNALPLAGGPKIDLIPLDHSDDLSMWIFETRQPFDWHGTPLWVASAEGLVIHKLLWARESGSERQLADVRAIMALDDVRSNPWFARWIERLDLQLTLDAASETRYDA